MVTMLIWSLVYRGFKFWSGQIRGVMVTMLIWSLVYRGFKFWSGQIRGVMVTMLIWSLVYRGFKLWSWVQVLVGSNQRCNGYHAHLEFSISWVQALVRGQIRGVMVTMLIWSLVYRGFKLLVRSNQRCNGYHAHLEFSISWVQALVGSNQEV